MNMVINRIINGTGHVYIDDEITPFYGSEITRQIMDFKSNGLHVVVNINSMGGSVFAGYQVIDAIIQTNADTHISGMAASIAGIIALFGHNVTANDFSTIMIHAPYKGNDDLLKIVSDRLKAILLAKTKFQEAEIEELMSGEKDYFFTAEEAWQKGMLTSEPIDTGRRIPVETSMLNIQEQFQVYNKLKNQLEMKEVINKLKLSATATEQDVLNKIEDLEKEAVESLNLATEAEKEATEAKAEITELKAKLESSNKNSATALIKNAVEAGKIAPKEADGWEELAVKDFAQAEKLINGIIVDHSTHVVNTGIKMGEEDISKDPSKLTALMRDGKAVAELQVSNVKLYNKYQEAYLNI